MDVKSDGFALDNCEALPAAQEFGRMHGEAPTVSERKMRAIRSIIHLELVGVVLIILCAALMAKGVGSLA